MVKNTSVRLPRALPRILCGLATVAGLAVALLAQDKPDFSGTWVWESGSSDTETPVSMTVTQRLVRTNVRGEPLAPSFLTIAVARTRANGMRVDSTYPIGVSGGLVGSTRVDSRCSVAWEGQSLVFSSSTVADNWSERREVWTLEQDGHLHVVITRRSAKGAEQRWNLTFRRA